MPLDWKSYDDYFRTPRQQPPIGAPAREEIASLSAGILQLDPADQNAVWGSCSPPGVSAQTVVRVPASVRHRFSSIAPGKALGLKIFKTERGVGAPPQARVIEAHTKQRSRLPGLPSPFVQSVYDGGEFRGRFYLVQEWIEGEELGEVLDSHRGLSVPEARQILIDLYLGILVPLWSAGTIWWDIRGANYCLQPHEGGRRLVMIDTDSILAYATEIVETPEVFTDRDRIKPRAMERVKTIVEKVAWTPLRSKAFSRAEALRLKRSITAIRQECETCFLQPGCLRGGRDAFERMLARLDTEVWSSV